MTKNYLSYLQNWYSFLPDNSAFLWVKYDSKGKEMYPYYCAKDKFKSRVHSLDGNPHVKENLQISQIL